MINPDLIEKIIYDLCVQANTQLPDSVLSKIFDAFQKESNEDAKSALGLILENARLAQKNIMPLCQDTGQVIVFIKGNSFPANLNEIVNKAVSKAYKENYFRMSVIKNALFDRTNTKTNTPCIIYTEISNEDEISVLIKGGGTENVAQSAMLSPTASEDEIINFVVSAVKKAGSKACPPYFLGIGIGGTIEYSGILSKKALLIDKNIDEKTETLAKKIQDAVNELGIGAAGLGGSASTCLDVKILTDFTHIACMPVSVSINCHSDRHATWNKKKGIIANNNTQQFPSPQPSPARGDGETKSNLSTYRPIDLSTDYIKVDASNIKQLKSLKQGDNVLLTGTIYTARDAAHKRLVEMIEKGEKLPFELKNSIIFYSGPCPCEAPCVVGSIGPTTAARMDKFAETMYKNGVLATIGKGERSKEIEIAIKQAGGLYFTAIGGIACFLSGKFIKGDVIAFEDLGAEAVYKFEVKDLPIRLSIC